MGKRHIPPHFGPFWAYSRTLPQGVEWLVEPLVKSLFSQINASPNEFLVRNPPRNPHFFEGGCGGGGAGWGSKMSKK